MVRSNTGRSARRPWRVLASARSWHRPVWTGWWLVLTGFGGLTFHAQFVTDDGAVILMHYTGLVEQTEHFESAAGANEPTNWADQYMRLAIRFETGAKQYAWMNTNLFIAAGRLEGTGRIEYAVYRGL
jgi:hypothetical protein